MKPAVWLVLIPIDSFVMMAESAGFTRNSSATYFTTAVKGAFSGTLTLGILEYRNERSKNDYVRYGSLGSDASVILKVTFAALGANVSFVAHRPKNSHYIFRLRPEPSTRAQLSLLRLAQNVR